MWNFSSQVGEKTQRRGRMKVGKTTKLELFMFLFSECIMIVGWKI